MKALYVVAIGCLALTGCTPDFAEENNSGVLIRIADITGISATGPDGDVLFSDVSDGFNDDAQVLVEIFRKNPTVGGSTPLEDVVLDRYEVQYFRTDGRNTEGVDVPYRITGPLAGTLHTPAAIDENAAHGDHQRGEAPGEVRAAPQPAAWHLRRGAADEPHGPAGLPGPGDHHGDRGNHDPRAYDERQGRRQGDGTSPGDFC